MFSGAQVKNPWSDNRLDLYCIIERIASCFSLTSRRVIYHKILAKFQKQNNNRRKKKSHLHPLAVNQEPWAGLGSGDGRLHALFVFRKDFGIFATFISEYLHIWLELKTTEKSHRHIRWARCHLCSNIYSFSIGPSSEISPWANILCKFSNISYLGKGKLLKDSAPPVSLV